MPTSRQLLALCVLLAASACSSGDESSDGIECGPGGSCPDGLICDERTNRCVASTGRDAAVVPDGAPDARTVDAAPAIDARSGDAAPAIDARTFDAPPPSGTTEILTGPPARTAALMATFTFTGGGTYQCRVDDAALAACTTPHTVTVTEGAHTFEVIATPPGGVPDPTPATYEWTVDRTGPTVNLAGPGEGTTTGRNVTFTWTVEEGAVVSCSLDSVNLAPCAGGMVSYTNLLGGGHIFRVRAADDLGNEGPQITRTFSVDVTGPTTTITPFARDLSDAAGTLLYVASEAGSTFECRLNSAAYAPCPAAGLAFTALPPGRNVARVRATDMFGNLGAEATYAWEVFGTVEVIFELVGVPQPDRIIVSHRGDGTVLDETRTNASGRAVARVLAGSQLTGATMLSTFPVLFTMTDVQPGDSVRLAVSQGFEAVATLRTGGTATDPCCSEYFISVGGGPFVADITEPLLNGDWAVFDQSYDSGGRVSFLGQARARLAVFRYMAIPDRAVPRGGTTDLVVSSSGWADAVDWPMRVANISGFSAITLEPGVYRRGVAYPIAEPRANTSPDNEESFTFHIPAPGFADGRYLRLRAQGNPVYKSIVATDVDVVDIATFLPTITDAAIDDTDPQRLLFTWKLAGSVDAADGQFIQFLTTGGEVSRPGFWFVVRPAAGDSVRLPILPPSLEELRPFGTTSTLGVQFVDSTAVAGYAAFKQVHQRFIDASSATLDPANPFPPPPVPSAGTTTRTTLRLLTGLQ